MSNELPEVDGVMITSLIEGYLKQEGYEFEDSEDYIEFVMANEIELSSGNGTEVTIPIAGQALHVTAEPIRVKEEKLDRHE